MCNKIIFEQLFRVNYISCSKYRSNFKRTSTSHLNFYIPNLQDVSKTSRNSFNKLTFTTKHNFLTQSYITGHVLNTTDLMGVRHYCTNKQPQLPKLMDFPQVIWPSVFKTMRNWILSNFIIKRYFDPDFSLPEFVDASKQAVELVSGHISKGDTDSLTGLVSTEVIQQVKEGLETFTLKQRQQFCIRGEDIYFCFPYEVGVMFPNEDRKDGENQSRFVEITMCYHVFIGLKEMREANIQVPADLGINPEYYDKLFVCNYRFIREFTKGVQEDWTINAINHYKPSSALEL